MITIDENALHLFNLELMEKYFAKLFGELLFLKMVKVKNDDDIYRYYIEDREGLEGVLEIRWDIFIKILDMLKKHNPKYYDKFMEELDK